MSALFRHIAITVSERPGGGFQWELLERDREGQWLLIQTQAKAVRVYAQAMAAGLVQLEKLVDDLDRGPRRAASSQESGPSAEGVENQPEQAHGGQNESAPRAGKLFGFGPLR